MTFTSEQGGIERYIFSQHYFDVSLNTAVVTYLGVEPERVWGMRAAALLFDADGDRWRRKRRVASEALGHALIQQYGQTVKCARDRTRAELREQQNTGGKKLRKRSQCWRMRSKCKVHLIWNHYVQQMWQYNKIYIKKILAPEELSYSPKSYELQRQMFLPIVFRSLILDELTVECALEKITYQVPASSIWHLTDAGRTWEKQRLSRFFWPIDYRCDDDGRFPVSASWVAIADPSSLSSREIVINSRLSSWKKVLIW